MAYTSQAYCEAKYDGQGERWQRGLRLQLQKIMDRQKMYGKKGIRTGYCISARSSQQAAVVLVAGRLPHGAEVRAVPAIK